MVPSSPDLEYLLRTIPELVASQVGLLKGIAEALCTPIEVSISQTSDLVTGMFSSDFSNRLLLHHATTFGLFSKKAFEYAFCASCQADSLNAVLGENPVFPGADITVDGTGYSLKTEASANLNPNYITISKLMEARWIRDCETSSEFLSAVQNHVIGHLGKYERILMLRARNEQETSTIYELVEIPMSILMLVGTLTSDDFSPRTRNGGTSVKIIHEGDVAFTLRLDGSVEKVTVARLAMEKCTLHATWKIPMFSR